MEVSELCESQHHYLLGIGMMECKTVGAGEERERSKWSRAREIQPHDMLITWANLEPTLVRVLAFKKTSSITFKYLYGMEKMLQTCAHVHPIYFDKF